MSSEPHVVVTITPQGYIRGLAIDGQDLSGYVFDASTTLSPRTEPVMVSITFLADKIIVKED